MADRFWRGTAGDGDWSNTNNWSATQYGATGAGAPASTNDVYILDGPDITAGLSAAATDLNSLTIAFGGNIGTASTSLTVAVSGTFTYRGRGQFCNITAGTNDIDLLHIESTGGGTFNLNGGTFTVVKCGAQGRAVVAAGAVISTSIKSAGMTLDIADNATDIPTGEFYGNGLVITRRDIDTVIVGPSAIYRTLEDVTVDTSISVHGRWENWSTGTVALVNAYPGSISTAERSPAHAFTVTNANKFEGAALFETDPIVTYTNAPAVFGRVTR